MPIDVQQVVGTEVLRRRGGWTPDDVILYQLALGAGVPPDDVRELAYTY